MNTYHINPNSGNPNICRATKGNCPFGSPDEHFESKTEARNAYEMVMNKNDTALAGIQKSMTSSSSQASYEERALWSNQSSYTPIGVTPKDQLPTYTATKNFTEDDLKAVQGRPTPMNWNEMGSSEKDMYQERAASQYAQAQQAKNWRLGVVNGVNDGTLDITKLDNYNLDRLANILAGPNVAHRTKFDKDGTVLTQSINTPDENDAVEEAGKKVRIEIDKRINSKR